MSNIRSLSDLKKQEKGGRGGGPPMPPGGGGGGFPFPGMFGGGGNVESSGNIKILHKEGSLQHEIKSAGGKLVVVDFTASWYLLECFSDISLSLSGVVHARP